MRLLVMFTRVDRPFLHSPPQLCTLLTGHSAIVCPCLHLPPISPIEPISAKLIQNTKTITVLGFNWTIFTFLSHSLSLHFIHFVFIKISYLQQPSKRTHNLLVCGISKWNWMPFNIQSYKYGTVLLAWEFLFLLNQNSIPMNLQ